MGYITRTITLSEEELKFFEEHVEYNMSATIRKLLDEFIKEQNSK